GGARGGGQRQVAGIEAAGRDRAKRQRARRQRTSAPPFQHLGQDLQRGPIGVAGRRGRIAEDDLGPVAVGGSEQRDGLAAGRGGGQGRRRRGDGPGAALDEQRRHGG